MIKEIKEIKEITRRDFLKMAGASFGSLALDLHFPYIEVCPKTFTFEQAFDPGLGVNAIDSGLKGSAYDPPFMGTVENGKFVIRATMHMMLLNEKGGTEDGHIVSYEWDSSTHIDPYADFRIAGYFTVTNPDGTIVWREIDTTKIEK